MSLDEILQYTTTPIEIHLGAGSGNASGFFYQEIADAKPEGLGNNYWLITNRHVVYNEDKTGNETLVDSLSFKIRYTEKDTNKLGWSAITISKDELKHKAKVHTDKNIDIAVIDIFDIINNLPEGTTPKDSTIWLSPINSDQLPDNSKFPFEICDDTVCIGYPRNFFDTTNLYPVAKSGIIASKWGANFEGKPKFLIDLQLFPGSSGSLVISKPRREDLNDNGQLVFKQNKIYYVLGVYSGEPIRRQLIIQPGQKPQIIEFTFNFGNVWYADLIPEIINNGVLVK